MREVVACVVAAMLAGCTATPTATEESLTTESLPAEDLQRPRPASILSPAPGVSLAFAPARPIEPTAFGYEPSIVIDDHGVLFVTAHKDNPVVEQGRMASWLWRSQDDGVNWEDVASPGSIHELQPALEGDIAVDGVGRLYFVDTYLADNTLSVWEESGSRWVSTRPFQGTVGSDDRPWLAAHHDGVVHYLGNSGTEALGPIQYSRSIDAGLTWSAPVLLPEFSFPGPGIEADPNNDSVYVFGLGDGGRMIFQASRNRGKTWDDAVTIANLETWDGSLMESVAVDDAGTIVVAWVDAPSERSRASKIFAAFSYDGGTTFAIHDLTPAAPLDVWAVTVAAGAPQTFAVLYDAATREESPDFSLDVLLTVDNGLTWTAGTVDANATYVGDFFQAAFAPSGGLHVAYERRDEGDPHSLFGPRLVVHARQLAGPNIV